MEFLLLQTGMVTAIAAITIVLWRRTENPGYVLPAVMMYFWSIHGAWGIIIDRLGGESGLHYQYLEQSLFPIRLDTDYFWALSLYGLFIVTTLLTALLLSRGDTKRRRPTIEPIRISPGILLLMSGIFGAIALAITAGSLSDAIATDQSLYSLARPELEEGGTFVFYQTSMELALVGTFTGLVAQIGGERGLLVRTKRSRALFAGNLLLLTVLFVYSVVAGSKGVMFATAIYGLMLHMSNAERPRYLATGIVAVVSMYIIISIDVLRYYSPSQLIGLAQLPPQIDDLTDSLTKSNEAFGAHFSMYGAVSYHVPPTYGLGFESLIQSLLPRFAQLVTRGPDLYEYYIQMVGGSTTQGFSIHYATAWYLDFGIPGIVAGSMFLGGLLAFVLNLRHRPSPSRSLLLRTMSVAVPAAFVSNFAYVVRAPGIEAVKGMMIDSVLLPTMILFIAAAFGEARKPKAARSSVWSLETH